MSPARPGNTSETAVQRLHGLPEQALIDMGDFAGGMLKYLRRHPVARVTVAGGFAKMDEARPGPARPALARAAASTSPGWPSGCARPAATRPSRRVPTANAAQRGAGARAVAAGLPLGDVVAEHAWRTAARTLGTCRTRLEIVIFDRHGGLVGAHPFRQAG